jgi:hypothetical protein
MTGKLQSRRPADHLPKAKKETALSTTKVRGSTASRIENVDLKLEVVVIPVSDVDRAKKFYGDLGWRLDADFAFDNGVRVVQFTPPGSGHFDPIRHEDHIGGARLGTEPLSDRLRHRDGT